MRIRYLLLHAYGTGGTIRTVMNQANALVARGHDVELVSVLRHRDEVRFPLDPRVRVTSLIDERGTADGADDAGPHAGGGAPPAEGWRAALGARRDAALARSRPELVPAGEFGARYFNRYVERTVARHLRQTTGDVLVSTRPALNVLAARYAPRSMVRVAQEHMNLSVHRADVRKAIAAHYPAFDAVAVLTERDRAEYAALLPRTRVVRIPNAVHSLDQQPADHGSRIAVAAGRLYPQKGFDLLLPAFRQVVERHPDWQLRIFGVGERKGELRALIEELHLYNHVFLMGHTSRLDDELAKASLYVLSSRFEGLPMVMIEAMAHGLPVVGFDCPTGPSDVLTDGREGILVPPEDVEALAGAMSRLMGDRALREKLGAAALRTARDYSPAEVHPRWESLFSELLGAAPGGTERER